MEEGFQTQKDTNLLVEAMKRLEVRNPDGESPLLVAPEFLIALVLKLALEAPHAEARRA